MNCRYWKEVRNRGWFEIYESEYLGWMRFIEGRAIYGFCMRFAVTEGVELETCET